jgi:hypothetical protein
MKDQTIHLIQNQVETTILMILNKVAETIALNHQVGQEWNLQDSLLQEWKVQGNLHQEWKAQDNLHHHKEVEAEDKFLNVKSNIIKHEQIICTIFPSTSGSKLFCTIGK